MTKGRVRNHHTVAAIPRSVVICLSPFGWVTRTPAAPFPVGLSNMLVLERVGHFGILPFVPFERVYWR